LNEFTMEDVKVVVIWFVIMGIVAVAKMVKRKGDAQDQQEEPQQQAHRRNLAQQQQQADREQRHQPEEQQHQDFFEQEQHHLPRRVERQQGQRREPLSQDEKHTTARKLIENAIEQQSSAARKHAETKPAAHPGDRKLPTLTSSIAGTTPTTSVAAVRSKSPLRRMLSSKRDIRNAIILREVFDRPRAYDV